MNVVKSVKEKGQSVSDLTNNKAVSRTATNTPGLLNIQYILAHIIQWQDNNL